MGNVSSSSYCVTEDIPSTRLKEMRKEVAQLWGRKVSTEVSRHITSLKKNPPQTNKTQNNPRKITEGDQRRLLKKRSAESTSANTFCGFLRVLGCLARQLVRGNEQGLSCAGLCRHPAHLLEDEPPLSQLPSTSLMMATSPPPDAPL